MATFKFHNKNIFYQIDGTKGEPIVFLNGIMMSSASWESFKPSLSKDNIFIRIDFLDQGNSDRMDGETYSHAIQVELLKAFFDHINIKPVNIMGVSYGGEVAIEFAAKYPQYVRRMVLSNTAAYTSSWLRDCGRAWNSVGRTLDGNAYYNLAIPIIYSPSFYVRENEWMEKRRKLLEPLFSTKEFQDRMERLVNSSEPYDERNNLSKITCECLVISSQYDFITPLCEQEYLMAHLPHATHVVVPDAGHAYMYEKPMSFTSLVLGFVNTKDDTFKI